MAQVQGGWTIRWYTHQGLKDVDPLYPWPHGPAALLFDDAQDIYEDKVLWGIFFNGVIDSCYHHYCIILFAVMAAHLFVLFYHISTPLVLCEPGHISLWPRKQSIGILLKHSKFEEVMSWFEHIKSAPFWTWSSTGWLGMQVLLSKCCHTSWVPLVKTHVAWIIHVP